MAERQFSDEEAFNEKNKNSARFSAQGWHMERSVPNLNAWLKEEIP